MIKAMKRYPPWVLLMGMFSLLFGCSESNYHKKDGKWHYDGVPVNTDHEPINFKVIDRYFAKDDGAAYYQGNRITTGNENSDSATFEVLNTWYAKDKFRVYYCDTERDSREYWSVKHILIKVVKAADPATFRMMSDGYTPRDKSHVFYEVDTVPIRDLDSYVLLEHSYAKDRVSGYYRNRELVGSDGASFVVLDESYAQDKAKVYSADRRGPVPGARLASFKALGHGYAGDASKGYFKGAVITGKDADSLVFLENTGYAKSRSQIFYDGALIPDADAASFASTQKYDASFDATDRMGRFKLGVRVKESP